MKTLIFFLFLSGNLFSYYFPGIVSFALDTNTGECVRTTETENRNCALQEFSIMLYLLN